MEGVHTMKSFITKYRNYICIIAAVLIAAVMTAGIVHARGEALGVKMDRLQSKLAGEVFRFHVLANSNEEKDQELKLKVRDEVIAYMKSEIPDSSSVKETKQWAREHLDKIEEISGKVIEREGFDYPVQAKVCWCDFPDKSYGDIVFPAGRYEALRIEIGAAKGHNWWCVLYPDLCFTSAVNAVVTDDGKEELKSVLDEEEYKMVTEPSKFKIRWFFFG
ncbi:stage II sporulation protein R [Lachnoclostridium sp. An181]|nr:stage II sporulation protein R [Lachnoclostridium sp. An181]